MYNREDTPKLCPFQTRSVTTHHTDRWMGDVERIGGSTKLPNKDVTHTCLLYCVEENCMAWDSKTKQCKRCK